MSDLPVGVLSVVTVLALGTIGAGLTIVAKKRRRWIQAREEQARQAYRGRLLSSLETLDLALTGINTAAYRGSEHLAQERVGGLARAITAANWSGDSELRQLVSVMVTHSDALITAGRDGLEDKDLDLLADRISETQRDVYRRMEVLLDQAFD
ncbi:MAG: hypothetical protein GY832_07405 [Chloroflexi bacterium]|nr:hypothetical protein [Chloroflexota bacterium]